MDSVPERFLIEITKECNLKCKCCDIWKKSYPMNNALTTIQKKEILQKFAQWYKERCGLKSDDYIFTIGFTGGEPFLKADEIIALATECKKIGMNASVNTNGTLVSPHIERLVETALSYIAISIDSHIETIHDSLRGINGTFQKANQTIKKLLEMRNPELTVSLQSILGNWNIDSIEDFLNYADILGVDGVEFQPLQFPFGSQPHLSWHKTFQYFPNEQQIDEGINSLIKLKTQGYNIFNSVNELETWRIYYKNPFVLPNYFRPCKAMYQNILMDNYGNTMFCYNLQLDRPDYIGNLLINTFDEIWNGNNAIKIKNKMAQCNKSCGVLLCHRDTKL